MEQKLALVNALAIIYNESELPGGKLGHANLIKQTTAQIKVPELIADGDDRSALVGIRQIINDVISGDVPFDRSSILQKIRVYCAYDRSFYDAVAEAMPEKDQLGDEQAIKKNISSNVAQLMLFNNRNQVKKVISKASFALNNNEGDVNYGDLINGLQDELSKLNKNSAGKERPSFVARVGNGDKEGFKKVFQNTKKQLSGAVLKTGWKGINKMMGEMGGVVPGECWVMPALPHNAKTTFSMSMFVSFGLFNDPADFVPEGKKALLLDISLENELEVNLPIIYKMVKEHFTGEPVNIKEIDPEEAANYITEKLSEKGWHIEFERHTSSDFTVETLREIVNDYEAEGYYIVATRVDYLGVSNKDGLSNGTAGSEVREMYRRSRNISSPRKMALISPHQLSPAAKQLKAMEPHKYVRQLPGKGYYDGCTTVDNEVDGELFFGITEVNGNSYLEVQRGKHRTIVDTPIAHRYCVLKFAEIGVLPWDLDKEEDLSLKSVNADAMNEEEGSFIDF